MINIILGENIPAYGLYFHRKFYSNHCTNMESFLLYQQTYYSMMLVFPVRKQVQMSSKWRVLQFSVK